MQEANRFKGKVEAIIRSVKGDEMNRDKILDDLSEITKEIDKIINEQMGKMKGAKELLVNPTGKGIRNDSGGLGHFGAPRGDRKHMGLDFSTTVGQNIVAPLGGKLRNMIGNETRKPMIQICPESKIFQFERLEILYVDKPKEIQWDVFRYVGAGDVIGTASNLGEWYPPEVGNHVHVQIIKEGKVRIDPKPFFFKE